jgi:regulator of sigma E protease
MHVTAVNGQPIDYFHEIRDIVDGSAGQPVTLSLLPAKPKRSNEQPVELTLQVVPRFAFDEQGHYDLLGLVPPTRVSAVEPGMPAQRAGIQAGDVLAKVGDQSWPTMKQLGSIIEKAAGDPVRVEVIRDGQRKVFESLQAQRRRERWLIGIRHEPSARVAVLSETLPGSTAYEQLNPPSGTRLTSVNGQSVEDWGDIQRALVAFAAEHPQGGDVDIEYRLPIPDEPVKSASLSLSAADVATLQNVAWELPFPFSYSIAFNWPYTTPVVAGGPIDAAAMGVEKTWYFMVQTYLTLARLFQGSVDPDQLRGPVGIAQIGTETAKRGWPYFMFFLGLISVNLAVFNFLPLPIVDGGHAVMLIIEGVRGKPIDGRVQIGLFIAGLALLGTMVIYITFHDIMRLIN